MEDQARRRARNSSAGTMCARTSAVERRLGHSGSARLIGFCDELHECQPRGRRSLMTEAKTIDLSHFVTTSETLPVHENYRTGRGQAFSLRIKERIYHRQLLIKDLAVLQVLAVESVLKVLPKPSRRTTWKLFKYPSASPPLIGFSGIQPVRYPKHPRSS